MASGNLSPAWLLPLAAAVSPGYAVDYLSTAEAQRLLFPQSQALFLENPAALSKDQRKQIKSLSGVRQRKDTQPVWRVENRDGLLGWFIVDDVVGKHEFITYAVGISPQGEVLGVEIMAYRETHGDEVRDAEWRQHFEGKTLADPFKLNKDVPNISGATLSSRNILDGVKRLLVLHQLVLQPLQL